MIRINPDGLLAEIYEQHPDVAAHLGELRVQMRRFALEADEIGGVPPRFWEAVNICELNRSHVPEEHGGHAAFSTVLRRALVAEQLGKADPGLALGLPGPGLSRTPIAALGTAKQQARLFARFESDRPIWGAFAISEPAAGSDAASVQTTARDGGDCWILDGEKCFIGSGARADYAVVFATTDRARGRFGLRAFVVERGTPGYSAMPMEGMLGVRAAQVSRLTFTDCRIPKEDMLGFDGKPPQGDAFSGAQRAWDFMRPLLSALIVGASAGMIDRAEIFLAGETRLMPRTRERSDRLIEDLRHRQLSARLLVHQAAWRYDRGFSVTQEACMAKAYAAKIAMATADTVVNLIGIDALRGERLFEKWYRDAKVFDILEGTGDMQRLNIAKLYAAAPSRLARLARGVAGARAEARMPA